MTPYGTERTFGLHMAVTKEIREYMAALAKRKARKMTREQRRLMAVRMNEARWGRAKGGK